MGSFDRWRILFENISGPSILLYVIAMTDFVIVFVKSLDVTWYSSIYGLQFLVAQGYGVLALGMLTLLLLSRYEPMKTMFRMTEQHLCLCHAEHLLQFCRVSDHLLRQPP